MAHTNHVNMAIANYRPASPASRALGAEGGKGRAKAVNVAKSGSTAESRVEVTVELTERLNKLAKGRPFSIMYRVKKYDPL